MTFGLTYSEVDAVREQQADVLSLDQALGFFERSTVRRRVRRKLWAAPHPRIVVLHNGPLTVAQQMWVAWLAAPQGSALSHGTAAGLGGFTNRTTESSIVHVTVPVGARRLTLPGVETHWSSRLAEDDMHPSAVPRRTRMPRSILDLASAQKEARVAAAVVFAAAQQRRATTADLREALGRRGPCRHHARIVEALADIDGGIQSVPEQEFDQIVRRLGLPAPTRQAVRQRPNGRYYLDVVWEAYGLAVEVDGGHHRTAEQWDADLERSAFIVAGGLRQMRFSSYAIRHKADKVGELLMTALRNGGWIG